MYQPAISCSCGAASVFAKENEEEKIHQFVMGLDDARFGSLCTGLIAADPLPSLGEAYSKVVREEQRLASARLRETNQEVVGFATRRDESPVSARRDQSQSVDSHSEVPASIIRDKNTLCGHCGRSGHEKKDCWQLVGFPEWWNERNAGSGRGGRGRGGRGAGVNNFGRGRGQANAAPATSSNASSFPEFTPDQWKALSKLIQEKTAESDSDKLSGKKGYGDMILDKDASHHMTGNLSLLHNLEAIVPCSIGFADGGKTVSVRKEVLTLSSTLTLPNDRFSRTLIGAGEERDGVYYFKDVMAARIHRAVADSDLALWHQRLGHPSFSVLSSLPLFSGVSKSVCSGQCDVCFRAKQTREGNLPIKFWGEVVLTAAYLINRTPSVVHLGRSPYEMLHGQKPSYDQLRGWKVFDLEREEYIVSRDVVFNEEVFPYSVASPSLPQFSPSVCLDEDWLVAPTPTVVRGSQLLVTVTPQEPETVISQEPVTENPQEPLTADTQEPVSISVTEIEQEVRGDQVISPSAEPVPLLGRGLRQRSESVKLRDYVTYNVVCNQDPHHAPPDPTSQSSSVQGTSLYPLSHYISDDSFSPGQRAFFAAITARDEPKHFKDAVRIKVWNNAMRTEVDALEQKRTWDICDLPPGKEALGCLWVYKTKYNSDGTIERYKARLVVQGNHQVEGEDFDETFAHVVKMNTVRSVLRLVAAKNWEVYQMDVNNAFLHGDLEEEVYMKLPPGFRHSHPGKVCRLRKSLYGLKQAPRCWFKKLSDALLRFGFEQSYDNYSLFSYSRKNIELRVLVYVDDLIIVDLGKLKYFLGIEISRGPDGIFLSQRKYALDIIAETGNLGCRPALTPLEQTHQLASVESPLFGDPTKYRRLMGRLIYLLNTRPELCYSVHLLSQFMKEPKVAHWEAALRVVRFLKGSPGQGIFLSSDPDLTLTVYCAADYNSCPLTRKSLSAFVVLLGGSPVAWKTKKQGTVSHSSAEAEYRAMAFTLREIKWFMRVLAGLGIDQSAPTRLFCDNKAAIYIASNPVFHERTKHIESDCHAVRNAVQDGIIVTDHVRTAEQLADILTKALGRAPFQYLLSKLGLNTVRRFIFYRDAEQRAEEAMSMRSEVQKEMEKEREKRLRMTRRLVLEDGIIYDVCVDGDADTEPIGQTET
ncbi:unnamed protein product [Microthlaspi erraticum]|uniref:CCHC-type domain-containing protein n=1 Tax=Microthlaspi erraticum TaxID=1685480 RepID=A0A6D2JGW2_9BRAS|nr:unnamed protein product [Microthlaspi erraticum]